MKPRILISGSKGSLINYLNAIEKAGGVGDAMYAPILDANGYDGLILAGGSDISPELYGDINNGLSVGMDLEREKSDKIMADAFIKAGKPVLGICRGMQMLNVLFGGTMIQDLGDKCAVHTPENGVDKSHAVDIEKGSVLFEIYGESAEVNSAHHQALKDVAEDFTVTARAKDGTVEAIEHKTLKIFGVQWHPERYDGGAEFVKWFVELCKE